MSPPISSWSFRLYDLFVRRKVERGAIAAAGHQAVFHLSLIAQRGHQVIPGDHQHHGDRKADQRAAPIAAAIVLIVRVVRHGGADCRARLARASASREAHSTMALPAGIVRGLGFAAD
jgi:hypothetical protein